MERKRPIAYIIKAVDTHNSFENVIELAKFAVTVDTDFRSIWNMFTEYDWRISKDDVGEIQLWTEYDDGFYHLDETIVRY